MVLMVMRPQPGATIQMVPYGFGTSFPNFYLDVGFIHMATLPKYSLNHQQ